VGEGRASRRRLPLTVVNWGSIIRGRLAFLKDYLAVADHAIVRRCVTQWRSRPSRTSSRAPCSRCCTCHTSSISAFRPAAAGAADGKRAVVQALRHAHAPLAREAKTLLDKLQ
jgi:hypothetical protein